jgi:3-methyladenine DNA glycosylase AlkD
MDRPSSPMKSTAEVEDLYRAIVRSLEAHADPELAVWERRFHDDPAFQPYGITTPVFRQILRSFKPDFGGLSLDERLHLAERLYASGFAGQAGVANHLLAISVREMETEHLVLLDRFVEYFHSWATTDDFCVNVLQPLLAVYPAQVLKLVRRWNRSKNRWKRRASVVVFARKVGESGRFTDEVLELCEALIWDPDHMVQKGVGWALKDNLRGARGKVLRYVKGLRRRGVPSTVTLYAIRDLKGAERAAVLAIQASRHVAGRADAGRRVKPR